MRNKHQQSANLDGSSRNGRLVITKRDQSIELLSMFSSSYKINPIIPVLLIIFIVSCSSCANGLNLEPEATSIDTVPTVLTTELETLVIETSPSVLPTEPESPPIERTPTALIIELETASIKASPTPEPSKPIDKNDQANVLSVEVKGDPGNYSFSVSILSPDTGCEQYADWWEVIDLDGALIYRRILAHSHVGEQPFTRSGGPVGIEPDTQVILRAHMNTSGYGGAVFKGSINSGFTPAELGADFAIELEDTPPLPDGCAF